MRQAEHSLPIESGVPTPEAGLAMHHPLLVDARNLLPELSGSPIWKAACGRRAAIRWPGHLSTFDVYSGEDRLELSDFSTGGLGVVSVQDGAPFAVGRRLELELRRE